MRTPRLWRRRSRYTARKLRLHEAEAGGQSARAGSVRKDVRAARLLKVPRLLQGRH